MSAVLIKERKMSHTRRKKGNILIKLLIVLVIFLGLATWVLYVAATHFKITQISFEGTDRYTEDELKEYIFGQNEYVNSLKLGYDLKHDYVKVSIPFIETYDVNIEYPDKVHVILYEKSIVAYIIYKGNYMYFDKDGIVVETSNRQDMSVPLIDGLEFDSVVLYSLLPVADEGVFNTILDLSQNLQKYDLAVDKIHFNNDLSIVLYIGDVRVNFGFGERLGEKLHELKQLEPQLAGLSGVLNMENYTEGSGYITFKQDEKRDKKNN